MLSEVVFVDVVEDSEFEMVVVGLIVVVGIVFEIVVVDFVVLV